MGCKRSTDWRLADLAAGARVAYTSVYVADDVLRFRPGGPGPCWRVASWKEAWH
jgi:hypothetical protein